MNFKSNDLDLEKILPNKKAPVRQLRVAELIKEVVAEIISQRQIDAAVLTDNFITVSKVKISPDLQNATIFVTSFQTENIKELISQLNGLAPKFRWIINQNIRLKYSPQVMFRYDDTLENASKIDSLIGSLKKD